MFKRFHGERNDGDIVELATLTHSRAPQISSISAQEKIMKISNTITKMTVLLLASMCVASLARAQSHSVTNYSNPPGKNADSKAATDATPAQSATADQQDAHHAGKSQADARTIKNKGKKPANGVGQRSGKAVADKTKGATAPVTMDGASKGGAAATMQTEPSERENSDAVRHAFDSTPAKK